MAHAFDNRQRPWQHGGGGTPRQAASVPVTFYRDPANKKQLNPTLLNEDAEKQAAALHDKINSAQIRRFFSEVKNLSLRLEQGRPWTQIEPFFRMLRSKAEYARGTGKIPPDFANFISDNTKPDRVKDEQDFRAFVLYFEAVLGFAYGKGLVKK
ncbi:MAG TPA: type III-A CRISPR-associated protein Csm2 [Anaerohalosphaeraceae bacterium]|nr:type III-A CRISPR-associated protein Csm2 [Anaerohalosphaeraceae bacterium]HOL32559.1 type III-A CRISPR-associated protein Csm2 [Anaerohalosphaeraceae bacterium]HOM77184.1 type III-A CRISPR-associated protein Csm2 [Anaerohalosphaeraceae bacterium]HPC65332.1 type III-A CRISPR-associated protein Csm2 [Anaerohalosphaeraceae bacterium]HPO70762.1 type III-A CRISPR-associated protein Csm2 [Anaerohalosphaeraceae bacterium]